jgi:hypothetical protein
VNKNKKYNSLSSVLLLSVLSAQACYADGVDTSGNVDGYGKVKIHSVALAKSPRKGALIMDMGKDSSGVGSYKFAFAADKACLLPEVSLLSEDGQSITNFKQTDNSVPNSINRSWKLSVDSVNKTGNPAKSYSIVFAHKIGDVTCPKIEGIMPELEASFGSGDSQGDLILTNASSKPVTITKISWKKDKSDKSSASPISVDFKSGDTEVVIPAKESRPFTLTLADKVCALDSDLKERKVKFAIEYKNEGETTLSKDKFEVEIGYSCNWIVERAKAEVEAFRKVLEDKVGELTTCQGNLTGCQGNLTGKGIGLTTCQDSLIDKGTELTTCQSELNSLIIKANFYDSLVNPKTDLGGCVNQCINTESNNEVTE